METCAEAPEAAAATECEAVEVEEVEGSSAAAADSPAPVENINALTPDYTPDGKDPSTVDTSETSSSDSSGMKVVLGAAAGAHLPPPAGAADDMDGVDADALADAAARANGEEALVLAAAPPREELNRNESVASSASDTPSSADSVYESEAHRRRREQLDLDAEALEAGPEHEHEPEVVDLQPDHEPEVVDPLPDHEPEVVDPLPDREPEVVDPLPDREPEVVEPEPDREPEVVDPQPDREPEVDPQHDDPEPVADPHPDCCSVDRPHGRCHHEPEADPHRPDSEPDIDCEFDVQPEAADHDPGLDRDLDVETGEDPEADEIPFEPPITETAEELILEQYFRQQESMSDISNESCHDELDPDEMDECLRVEIAAVSSDSEANENEKWRSIFSSSINKEDDDSYLDSLQLSAQELFVQKVEVMDSNEGDGDTVQIVELPPEEEEVVLEQPDDILSFPSPPQEVTYNPLTLQVLSRISEDGGENGKDGSGADEQHQRLRLASDPGGKKLPKDFCVIQETMSENVSTEHVDFKLARKQWLEMEEQTKNRVVLPATRQPIMHGSHSFMYTPVRNVERPHRKAHELESLTLSGDYPHTLFSPCSEDSGLDDSSYRSPYDDPETPIEKEIRMAMEREEDFRRERGRRIPRSTSTPLTPSFIITSSPAKVPALSHAATANNVIIQEPADDQSSVDAVAAGTNADVIILETSHLIIRSSSDYCLNKACEQQPQEKIFLSNPFFKLRSRSTLSLVDEEIRMARQREEELRRERACRCTNDRFNAPSPDHMDALAFHNPDDVPVKCKSSPSSPMKTVYKMDRSTLSCEHRFPEVYSGGRRKSALALRWEAGEFAAGGD